MLLDISLLYNILYKSSTDGRPIDFEIFNEAGEPDERAMYARRAFELVQKLLSLL